ncbi:MAG: NADP-dependent isocitrate dehydrogenase, partial [Myxococcota bacterium]
AKALNRAIGTYLENQKLPSRKVRELDNRGSTFYLALYWAQALAEQDEDAELRARFTKVAKELGDNADRIDEELINCQGDPVDIGGYFRPDQARTEKAMRPSATLNAIIDAM